MRTLMISTEQIDKYGAPTRRGASSVVTGFGVLGDDVRDRQIAGAGSHAFTAVKATPGTPAWRPPTS